MTKQTHFVNRISVNLQIIRLISSLILILFIQFDLASQIKDIAFKHITIKDGLPNSNIQCIFQDSKGFMWFGSEDGLIKYDGCTFQLFKNIITDSTSISANYIRAIVEDSKGNLWIGNTSGINMFDREKNSFISYQYDKSNPNSISPSEVFSIVMDAKDNLWIGLISGGLCYFDSNKKSFVKYLHDKTNPYSIASNKIYTVYIDHASRLWIGMWNGLLDLYDKDKNKFTHFEVNDKHQTILNRNQIRAILEDKQGTIWIATSGSGLYKMVMNDDGNPVFYNYHHLPGNENSLNNNYISCLIEDADRGLWIGTENGGLDFFDTQKQQFFHHESDKFDESSLSYNSIWSLFQDKSQNLWVGTFTSGINLYIKNANSIFKSFKNIPCNNQSLSFNTVSCFLEDRQGNLWVGTDGGGLNFFNRTAGTFTVINSSNSKLSSDHVLSLYEDSFGNFWIGTWEGGLNLYDRTKGTFQQYTKENSGLGCNNIISIIEDKNKTLWVGTFWGEGGISYFDRNKNRFITYLKENSNLSDNTTYTMLNDKNGTLWIGTLSGLNKFDNTNKTFTDYYTKDYDSTSLSQNTVLSLLETHDSILWVGTAGGLNRLDRKNGKFTRYYLKNGLPNNYIAGMEEDAKGFIWISTENGISRFDPKKQTFRNFDESYGLQGAQFFRCSHYKARNGEIYFGGTQGFSIVRPDYIEETHNKPLIYITDFKIFNKPLPIGAKGSPLKKDITETKDIILSYKQSSFSLEYAALNYISPQKTKYSYILEGFDKEWYEAGNKRTANYTNLSPGKYIFRVKVPYNDGISNEEGTSLRIIIIPPYWQTWWFRFLAALVLIIILLTIYYIRVWQIRSANILLEHQIKERTKELSLKNKLLKNQSDNLNEINTLLEEKQEQIEEQTEELKFVNKQLNENNSLLMQQASELSETNTLLEEKQQRIEEQTQELMYQKNALEKINAELNELIATKDKFFSIVAHDIKNPFNTVLGFSELLVDNFNKWTNEKKLQIASIIHSSSQSVYALLENLLQWSRSQRGIIPFEPKRVKLSDRIDYCVALLKESADSKNIQLTSQTIGNEVYVKADIQMLDTILRNLISNAIKFTKSNGLVTIQLKADNNFAIVSVKDNGVGISPESLNKLFKIGSHHTTNGTNQERGTGLGLILINDFVKKHGGEIGVESKVDEGSTFFFNLPLWLDQ